MMDTEELNHLGIVSCTVSGVTKVDNRGCQLAVDKAVKSIMLSPGLPDGTKVADYITYFLLVWKEGMSLEAVMENGKFPKQEDGSVVLTSRVSHAIQHIIPRGDSTPTSVSAVLCQVFMRPLQGTPQLSSSPDTPAPSLQSPEAPSQSVIVNVPSELVLAEYIVNLQIAKVPASSQPSIKVPDNDLDVCTLVCPTLPEIEELNSEVLEPLLQQEDVKSTEELRLCGRGIRRTHPSFQPLMSAVRSLDLSHNRLTTTAHVENMPNLVSLGLSYNAISSLEGMKGLLKLQYIDLSWNSLNNLSEVASTLRKNTPNLLILDLRGNEWEECLEDTPLRLFLIGHLKLLQCLNGVRVKGEESEGALRAVVSSHLSMATIASKVRASPQVPQTLSLLPTADYLHEKSSMRPSQLTSEQSDWWKNITSVCGNKLSLVQIKAVGRCSNLKWASFSHNHLQQLDGLEECGELEELHADHNWLRKIDSACSLTHLVHLSLSHNLIPTLSPLGRSPLLNLKYLDISSNRLTSLSGVEECSALLELYAGNNKLKTARDILPVKRLPQVMILDLYGNPIHTEERMLRLYAAYHITTLKTFNGAPLESKEFTAAKEMYGGRLNAEFVQEKTGHSRFHELKQMDYPHCNLRIVELQPVNQFASLLSLNLEHNQLTSFNGLLQLPNLKVLCLNHNKIERLSTGDDVGGGVLPSLQVLHVAYNQLGSLVPLQLHRMPTLRALFLQGNQLVNLDGLIGLTKLTELVLDHNKIRNIGEHSFSSLTDLRVLHIEENRLRELRNFAWLVHLEKLFLGMNRIQEFADLDELCALSHVNELSLLSNPVSRRLHYRTQILCRLPHLTILDGVTVTEDEQMRVRAILHEQEPAESYGIVHTSSGPFVVTNMSNLPQDGVRNPLPHHHPPNSDSSYYRK
jgi:Leucine-rich repeat (LRR) protein